MQGQFYIKKIKEKLLRLHQSKPEKEWKNLRDHWSQVVEELGGHDNKLEIILNSMEKH